MIANLPPLGSRVIFRDGVRKPKEWSGTVIAHDPPEDDWDAGIRVDWPTMRYAKKKGVVVFHSIPSNYLNVGD
jgi:hypothetical protein